MSNQEQYERAVQIVRQAGRPGLSMLMRGLQIHFNAAARLMDQMEQAGVVTPVQPDGNRRLITQPAHACTCVQEGRVLSNTQEACVCRFEGVCKA